MVYFVRTAKVIGSKSQEAFKWSFKVADFIKNKTGTELELLMNVTGPQSEIHWLARTESVGAFEKSMSQLLADQDYLKMLLEGLEYFVDGSAIDNYFRSVPRN
jgi:hypothetical protein